MAHHEHDHHAYQEPAPAEPRSSGLTGYAIAKYGAILLIVIAILVFLGVYVIPRMLD